METKIEVMQNMTPVERLKGHVYKLSHEIGERNIYKYGNLNEAAEYIIEKFKSFGYEPEFQSYSACGKIFKNIIVTKPGDEEPGKTLILGAHYDSHKSPGADDNASSVAGLLEVARNLRDKKSACTIKFIAFANEEPPFFKTKNMGSRVYTKAAKEKGENIKGALILEMIGYYSDKPRSQHYPPIFNFFYPSAGNFIGVVGNFRSKGFVKNIVSSFKTGTDFPIEWVLGPSILPGIDYSDNWSFWKEGYPAVMITDTAFYRNPHYHKASDTYETLNYEGISEVVKGLTASLAQLAN
ncbi:MAG: M20/M25/M40 family metallo-hydrolase [Candidatus Omnitrophica bacterium]|nr:M20/M25/M40 family metallo-hydrolase [Candidatus Omnitrophota bacterium]